MILVQPSLPFTSGMNRRLGKPRIYDHLEWKQPTQYDLVGVGKTRRSYAIARLDGSKAPKTGIEDEVYAANYGYAR